MVDTKRSRNPHSRACLGCQKRKTRCAPSQRDPSICSYCMKTGAQCVFEAPLARTPLTRKNLDALEGQCMLLKRLLQDLRPGIDINAELAKLSSSQLSDPREKTADGGSHTGDLLLDEDFEWSEALSSRDPRTIEFKGDGFGSTSTATSGYLGSSSASRILQRISELLSPDTPSEPQDGRPIPGSIRVLSSYTPCPTVNSALASLTGLTHLIDAYFLFYNSNYPILHERSFRERWEKRARISQTSSWVPICYIVLSIGQWVLGDNREDCPYYAKARAWISAECLEIGALGAVQAFLLMGNYAQKRDRPNTGYNLMGIAHRMALGLGIHREIAHNAEDSLALERRRQLFWTLFCFDSGLSITTGRPATIVNDFLDVRMPRNIDDSDLDLASRIPPEVDYPTAYSAIIAHSHLAIVANEIYTKFLSARCDQLEKSFEMAVELEERIQKWEDTLPSYFTDGSAPQWFMNNRAMVYWRARNLRILLWRGSQRQQNHKNQSDKLTAGLKCSSEATKAINEVAEFCVANSASLNILLSWYATYFLFQAMLFLEVQRLEERAAPSVGASSFAEGSTSYMALGKGRECLNMLNTPKSAAGRCLETLDRIHQHMAMNKQSVHSEAVPEQQQLNGFEDTGVEYDAFGGLDLDTADPHWMAPTDLPVNMLFNGQQVDDFLRGFEEFSEGGDLEQFGYPWGSSYRF